MICPQRIDLANNLCPFVYLSEWHVPGRISTQISFYAMRGIGGWTLRFGIHKAHSILCVLCIRLRHRTRLLVLMLLFLVVIQQTTGQVQFNSIQYVDYWLNCNTIISLKFLRIKNRIKRDVPRRLTRVNSHSCFRRWYVWHLSEFVVDWEANMCLTGVLELILARWSTSTNVN